MQFSTFTWIITAMLAGHALAMPRGGGNAANAGNGNSNAAASGASTDGLTCEGGGNNLINTGVCQDGKCNIEFPGNELSRVDSADCE